MSIRSANSTTPHNIVWDLLFGSPAVNTFLARGGPGYALKQPVTDPHSPRPYLRLVEPQPSALPNTPLTPRFMPRPFGGAGWSALAALLISGGLYALERYAHSPNDLPPSPDDDGAKPDRKTLEQQQQYLEALQRQYHFDGEAVPEWLRQLLNTNAIALALINFVTPPVGHHPVTINSTGVQNTSSTDSSGLTPDDWEKLIDKDPIEFLRAARRWDVTTRHAIAARIDAGETAPEVLEWFKTAVRPTAKAIGGLITQPRQWPENRRGLVHDMRARLRGFAVTEIYLEDGDLARVRAMFNLTPNNLLETVVAIQFGLETVSFSIDGLRGVHLAPTFPTSLFNSILKNLINNSAEHPGTDPLTITIRLRGRELTITDNGAGMTPKALEAIRNGTPIHNGEVVDPEGPDRAHGQGWSKSIRDSCERLEIQWTIDSKEGGGTTVTLTLPSNSLTLDGQFSLPSHLSEEEVRNHLIPFYEILDPAGKNRMLAEWARVSNTTPQLLLLSFDLPNLE